MNVNRGDSSDVRAMSYIHTRNRRNTLLRPKIKTGPYEEETRSCESVGNAHYHTSGNPPKRESINISARGISPLALLGQKNPRGKGLAAILILIAQNSTDANHSAGGLRTGFHALRRRLTLGVG